MSTPEKIISESTSQHWELVLTKKGQWVAFICTKEWLNEPVKNEITTRTASLLLGKRQFFLAEITAEQEVDLNNRECLERLELLGRCLVLRELVSLISREAERLKMLSDDYQRTKSLVEEAFFSLAATDLNEHKSQLIGETVMMLAKLAQHPSYLKRHPIYLERKDEIEKDFKAALVEQNYKASTSWPIEDFLGKLGELVNTIEWIDFHSTISEIHKKWII
jgi:hypothetical protein